MTPPTLWQSDLSRSTCNEQRAIASSRWARVSMVVVVVGEQEVRIAPVAKNTIGTAGHVDKARDFAARGSRRLSLRTTMLLGLSGPLPHTHLSCRALSSTPRSLITSALMHVSQLANSRQTPVTAAAPPTRPSLAHRLLDTRYPYAHPLHVLGICQV